MSEELLQLEQLRKATQATADSIRTLHRRAEESLAETRRALEERTRQLATSVSVLNATLESSPDGVIAKDLSRRVVVANARFLAISGVPSEKIGGRDGAVIDAIMLDKVADRDLLLARINEQRHSPESAACDELSFLDGRTFERYATPQFVDARCTGTVETWREVTDQKRNESELTRLNRAFRMLSRSNNVLVRIHDESALLAEVCGIVVETGGYRMAWVGYAMDDPEKSIVPRAHAGAELGFLAEVSLSWAEDNPAGQNTSGRAIRSGQPVVVSDPASEPGFEPWRAAKQSRGYGSVVSLPLFAEARPLGVLTLYTGESRALPADELELLCELASDLAFGIEALRTREQRRMAEAQVMRLNEELEERVRRRTAQLEAAYADLESFSYSVAHDLRAPLRTMSGFVNLMSMDVENGHLSRLPDSVARITASAEKMSELIDGLLRVARAAHGKLTFERVDLQVMLEEVLAEQKPGESAVVLVGRLPVIHADSASMRQVWTNLVSNAIKYSAMRAEPAIAIDCTVGPEEMVVSVCDTGAGFDQAFASKLFGVFQRLHRAAEFGGTGIGLAIVRRIVERHGGRVWAEGRPDAGATFYVALPVEAVERP
jgi:PAS domain S-box-containing protein